VCSRLVCDDHPERVVGDVDAGGCPQPSLVDLGPESLPSDLDCIFLALSLERLEAGGSGQGTQEVSRSSKVDGAQEEADSAKPST
jgi:hypothetical protein